MTSWIYGKVADGIFTQILAIHNMANQRLSAALKIRDFQSVERVDPTERVFETREEEVDIRAWILEESILIPRKIRNMVPLVK